MNIGITGASGFIGFCLCRHLLDHSAGPVRQLIRNGSLQAGDTRAEVIRGDLLSPVDCERFVADLQVIYYLAHVNSPVNSDLDPAHDAAMNLVPFLNFLHAIRGMGTKPHVVYFSSGGAIYQQNGELRPYRETDPCAPFSSYGIQKLAAEHYLRVAAEKGYLTAAVLRVANAYGMLLPQHRLQGFIGVAVNNILQNRPVRVFGNPHNVRDYVHVDDICAIAERITRPLQPFSVYNVGSGEGHSVAKVLDVLAECADRPVEIMTDTTLGCGLVDWVVLDIEKAMREVGWRPTIDLRRGIQSMLAAHRV